MNYQVLQLKQSISFAFAFRIPAAAVRVYWVESAISQSEHNTPMAMGSEVRRLRKHVFSQKMASTRFVPPDTTLLKAFIEEQANKNTFSKTKRDVSSLKEFIRMKVLLLVCERNCHCPNCCNYYNYLYINHLFYY